MKGYNELIVVDACDDILGYKNLDDCHKGDGVLHRAFSVYIINDKNEILVQKRSNKKPLWPLYWSNSCCSHPRKGETYEQAAERRLPEELGFTTELKKITKFVYQARYLNIGSENEMCVIFLGKYSGKVKLNPEEVAECKWADINEIKQDIIKNPDKYTPWFKIGINKLRI